MFRCSIALTLLWALCAGQPDTRVPNEVCYKTEYIHRVPKPPDFTSATLWGIAIADTSVPGYENATVEITRTQLSCRVKGKAVILNDDRGSVRGGLYTRLPWFATDAHGPIPLQYSRDRTSVILRIGTRPEKVGHFWAASPRTTLPVGEEGCTVRVRAKISRGALLQVGMDYWRDPTVGYGTGGNNHEAGASNWYFPSYQWQDAVFNDAPKQP